MTITEIINVFECQSGDFKRFILFACNRYYPAGELCDAKDSFDTLPEAKQAYLKLKDDYVLIYDRIADKKYYLKDYR